MPYPKPNFPSQVWDGLTNNIDRVDTNSIVNMNSQDWERLASETISVETNNDIIEFLSFTADNDSSYATGSAFARVDTTSGSVTIDLPTPADFPNVSFTFKKTDASLNTVTIDGDSEMIDGSLTVVLQSQYDHVTVISDGTQWWIKNSLIVPSSVTAPAGSIQAIGYTDVWLGGDEVTTIDIAGTGDTRGILPGRCLTLNGSNQHINCGTDSAFQIPGDVTVSAWIKPSTLSGNRCVASFSGWGGGTATNAQWSLQLSGVVVQWLHQSGSGSSTTINFLGSNLSTGEWVHLTVVRDTTAKTVTLYKNGVLSSSVGYTNNATGGTTANCFIGAFGLPTWYFAGQIAKVAVHDRMLTTAEVGSLARATIEKAKIIDRPTDPILELHLEDNSNTSVYNSGSLLSTGDGTVVNSPTIYEENDVPGSFANLQGYSDGGSGVVIPLDTSDLTVDVLGDPADYTGIAPRNGLLVDGPMVTLDGVDDYLEATHLVGTETVTSSDGTSTPSISAGRIDFTAGTCWNLLLSDGTHYTFSEDGNVEIYDVSGADNHATLKNTAATIWDTRQQEWFYAVNNGASLYEHASLDPIWVPYENGGGPLTITPPSGYSLTEDRPAARGLNVGTTALNFAKEPDAPWTDSPAGWYEIDGGGDGGSIAAGANIDSSDMSFFLTFSSTLTPGLGGTYFLDLDGLTGSGGRYIFAYSGSSSTDYGFWDGTSWHVLGAHHKDGVIRELEFRIDGSSVELFVDGVSYATSTGAANPDLTNVDNAEYGNNTNGFLSKFVGNFHHSKIVSGGVTIWEHNFNGHGVDISGNGFNHFANGTNTFPTVSIETALAKDEVRVYPNYSDITSPLDNNYRIIPDA